MSELSNYKYIKTIGEGTFGKVKLAIHILTGEKVAIKILQKNLIKGQKQYERIQNEIKYLKLLNHPNIIKIYEVIENDSSFFIVMEYATGGELFNYIVLKEKLDEKETSFFFYLGKMMGAKTIYIEVFDRIDKPTMTGKIVYPVTDRFIVEWEEMKKVYPKAINLGSIF